MVSRPIHPAAADTIARNRKRYAELVAMGLIGPALPVRVERDPNDPTAFLVFLADDGTDHDPWPTIEFKKP